MASLPKTRLKMFFLLQSWDMYPLRIIFHFHDCWRKSNSYEKTRVLSLDIFQQTQGSFSIAVRCFGDLFAAHLASEISLPCCSCLLVVAKSFSGVCFGPLNMYLNAKKASC